MSRHLTLLPRLAWLLLALAFPAWLWLGLGPRARQTALAATGAQTPVAVQFVPALLRIQPPTPIPTATPEPTPTPPGYTTPHPEVLDGVNAARVAAGAPTVTFDETLDDNCWQHARYMVENGHLTHQQNPALPYASAAGEICAENGNIWLASPYPWPYWESTDPLQWWLGSVTHRLWLLYPTTTTFGFGYYTNAANAAGGALDVLSALDWGDEESFTGWPLRYPGPGQSDVPAWDMPITLSWSYLGPAPILTGASLTTSDGAPVAHTANTSLPSGHKGVQLLPANDLAPATTYQVAISGTYDGAPFDVQWQFSTAVGTTSRPVDDEPPRLGASPAP